MLVPVSSTQLMHPAASVDSYFKENTGRKKHTEIVIIKGNCCDVMDLAWLKKNMVGRTHEACSYTTN
jgi:hypothetical protein